MVQSEELMDLSNLFILFNVIPRALDPVVKEFTNKVKNEGKKNIERESYCLNVCSGLGNIKSLLSSKVKMN